jgi:hypothetical protein
VAALSCGGRHYRVVSISDPWRRLTWRRPNYYTFVQVWDGRHIWAQPLLEHSDFWLPQREDAALMALVADAKGRDMLLLMGYTFAGRGESLLTGAGFSWKDAIWKPFSWPDSYEPLLAAIWMGMVGGNISGNCMTGAYRKMRWFQFSS